MTQMMTEAEINAGLVLPYVAQAVAGKAGAAAILLSIFMVRTTSIQIKTFRLVDVILQGFDIDRICADDSN